MKTVNELYDELGQLIKEGHGNTRVIANCEFNITKGNGYYNDFPLCHLKDVYYQSGDIELDFSQEEEFTEENKYKDDNNGWHDLVADLNDLPKEDIYLEIRLNDENTCYKYCTGFWEKEEKCFHTLFCSKVDTKDIIAWKEIIPPKE